MRGCNSELPTERILSQRLPTYFISHGGGPWPWVPSWRRRFANLETSLAHIHIEVGETPKAVLVVSGHWEAALRSVLRTLPQVAAENCVCAKAIRHNAPNRGNEIERRMRSRNPPSE